MGGGTELELLPPPAGCDGTAEPVGPEGLPPGAVGVGLLPCPVFGGPVPPVGTPGAPGLGVGTVCDPLESEMHGPPHLPHGVQLCDGEVVHPCWQRGVVVVQPCWQPGVLHELPHEGGVEPGGVVLPGGVWVEGGVPFRETQDMPASRWSPPLIVETPTLNPYFRKHPPVFSVQERTRK